MTLTPKNPQGSFDELTDYAVTEETTSNQVRKVLDTLLDICSGKQTSIEKLELGEFSIPHVGTTF
jgi:altronate dehydratase